MTFAQAVFWGCAALAVVPAAGMLIARSIVRMAFLLLGSLAGFAGIYLLLGAGFVGFAQILVYIGGILVLFLFGVMLTSREGIAARRRLPAAAIAPAVSAGLLVLAGAVYL
ncbi:MAG: NADH-quinone oxidoreductase subunit J, partial [Planctomycetota bacterium]